MQFSRFEPGTHGFQNHQDIHYTMEANAYITDKIINIY